MKSHDTFYSWPTHVSKKARLDLKVIIKVSVANIIWQNHSINVSIVGRLYIAKMRLKHCSLTVQGLNLTSE